MAKIKTKTTSNKYKKLPYLDKSKKKGKRYSHKWKYKNLTLTFVSLAITLLLSQNEQFVSYLMHLGKFGFVGALIAGFLCASSFTIAIGALILFEFSKTLNLIELCIIAGIGCMMGDLIILKLFRNGLENEVYSIYEAVDHKHQIVKLFHTKYFSWTLPVIGALIIMSPFPDEIGVSILGLTKMSSKQFILLSFVLDTVGILILVSGMRLLD